MTPPNDLRSTPQSPANVQITPELIKKVTERVYAMLLEDLRREKERGRRQNQGARRLFGGR